MFLTTDTPRAAVRHVRRHIIGYAALVLATCGSAAAIGPATSAPLGALNFTLGNYQSLGLTQDVNAQERSTSYKLPADGAWHTILIGSLANWSGNPAMAVFNATVSGENPGAAGKPAPGTITMRMVVDGVPEDGTYSTTIAPGEAGNLAGLLKCNGLAVGTHKVELQLLANGSDLVIDTAADDGLRPIVVPPGSHSLPGS